MNLIFYENWKSKSFLEEHFDPAMVIEVFLENCEFQVELDDVTSQLKNTDEMLKQASADAARLAEELRQEQEHSVHVERMRRALEVQIKEMQVAL